MIWAKRDDAHLWLVPDQLNLYLAPPVSTERHKHRHIVPSLDRSKQEVKAVTRVETRNGEMPDGALPWYMLVVLLKSGPANTLCQKKRDLICTPPYWNFGIVCVFCYTSHLHERINLFEVNMLLRCSPQVQGTHLSIKRLHNTLRAKNQPVHLHWNSTWLWLSVCHLVCSTGIRQHQISIN